MTETDQHLTGHDNPDGEEQQPTDPGEQTPESSAAGPATRTRTRSRSRTPRGGPDGSTDATRSAPDRGDAGEATPDDAGEHGNAGGATDAGGSAGDETDAGGTAANDPGASDAGGGDGEQQRKRRRRRGGRGRGRGRGRGDAKPASSPTETADAAGDDAGPDARDGGTSDDDTTGVEDAIARGGTRVAARRGRGDGGGRRGPQRHGGVSEDVRRAMLEGPPRTMLVTAGEDRTQIAVLEDRTVVEHYVTRKEDVTYVGNIYMARVQNVLPGMEAAFLDIGKGRNGVLYAGEVLYDELDLEEGADERIENALKPGQKVLVQVTKDPMGTKGPRLTMHLSLAGRYLVLAPSSDLFGISRKLTDKERDRLRRIVKQVKPDEHGVIVRTAAEGASEEQITADVGRLLAKWERVEKAAADAKALQSVYEEPPLVVKVIRDNFGPEFVRCVVDDERLYHEVRAYLEEVAPELLDKVELYGQPSADARARAAGTPVEEDADTAGGTDAGDREPEATPNEPAPPLSPEELRWTAERREDLPPLFDAYDVSDQLRKAMSRKVWLPSGGYLIIETTEAMKVIDVNTGKFTGDADTNLEEVVLKTNLEAADEIVRQLRLRDMGGIIIIDFIDMLLKANQDQVVRRLKRELLRDRTKTRVSDVSRLGLVQMTRKNVSQGLVESFSHACEACDGRGLISELV